MRKVLQDMRYTYRIYKVVEYINQQEKELKKEYESEVKKAEAKGQQRRPVRQYASIGDCVDYFLTKRQSRLGKLLHIKPLSEEDIKDAIEAADSENYIDELGYTGIFSDAQYRVKSPKGRRLLVDRIWILPYAMWNEFVSTYSPLEKVLLGGAVTAVLLFFLHAGAYIIRLL